MTKTITALLAVAITVGGVGHALGFPGDKGGEKKSPEQVFKALDKDQDGGLSLAEFTAGKEGKGAEKAEKVFKARDADANGSLSLAEFIGKKKEKKDKG